MIRPARTGGCSPILRTAISSSTRPPARTDGGVGGLLGGPDVEERSHLAPDHPVSFFLVVQPTREDAWDRDAIVRGFWGCPDSAWSEWRGRIQRRPVACRFGSSDEAPAGIRVVALAVARVACSTRAPPSTRSASRSSFVPAQGCARMAGGSAGCSFDAGRRCGDRSAPSSRPCSQTIAGSSKPTCSASNSIGSGPAKRAQGVLNFVMGWFKALRWQRLPEMERLGDFLLKHINGFVAYCDHAVRFGVVEAINTTIKAVLRRARGMRDDEMLLLKLKWATAHPIRSARDLVRFLTAQPLYSNR